MVTFLTLKSDGSYQEVQPIDAPSESSDIGKLVKLNSESQFDQAFIPDVKHLRNTLSTGILSGFELSIDDPATTFTVGVGTGIIVNNYTNPAQPTYSIVALTSPLTGQIDPYIASADTVYIGLNASGQVMTQLDTFTDQQRRSIIQIGWTDHSSREVIEYVAMQPAVITDISAQFLDFLTAFGPFCVNGNIYTPQSGLHIQRRYYMECTYFFEDICTNF